MDLSPSNDIFRVLVEHTSTLTGLLNSDGLFRYLSPAVLQMLGYAPHEILDRFYLDFVHPDDRRRVEQAIRLLRSSPAMSQSTVELRVRHRDNSWRVLAGTGTNFLEHPAIAGIVFAFVDVTARQQAQDTLRATEDFARSIINSSLDMIIAVDLDRKITEFNPAAEKSFGYTRAQVLGQSIDLLYANPAEGATVNQNTNQAGRHLADIWNRRKNDEVFPSHLSASVLTDAQGRPIGYMGISRDVTELKRAEEALRRRADEFSALYETTRDLATQYDLSLLLQTIVNHATALLRVAGGGICLAEQEPNLLTVKAVKGWPAEVVGRSVPADFDLLGQVAQSRRPLFFNDYARSLFPEETVFPLPVAAILAVPMLFGGDLLGVLFVNQAGETPREFVEADTRLLELFAAQAASAVHNAWLFEQVYAGRERLKILSQNLIQAQESERRNIAGELHDEIGQSLTALQFNTQAIEPLVSDPNARRLLEANMAMIERVLEQVRSLSLNLRPSILDDFGLVPALRWLADQHRNLTGMQVEFVSGLAEARCPTIIETTCFRVTQEALTNAIRHANARHVWIRLAREEDELRLAVTDDGQGFDVTRKLEDAASGKSMGLIGLHERVVLAGGRVEIKSAPGEGTTIQAAFPLSNAPFTERRRARRKGNGKTSGR